MAKRNQNNYNTLESIEKKCPLLAERMKVYGYRSINQLCKSERGFLHEATHIGNLLNRKISIYNVGGDFYSTARKLSQFTGYPADILFPDQYIFTGTNKKINKGRTYQYNFDKKGLKTIFKDTLKYYGQFDNSLKVIEMFLNGYDFDVISRKFNIGFWRAHVIVNSFFKRVRKNVKLMKALKEFAYNMK